MRTRTTGIRLSLLVVAASTAACGVWKKDRKDGQGDGQSADVGLEIADADQWSKATIGGARIPGSQAMAAGGYESCPEYETALMQHAQLVQAMYVRRFLAWADYNWKAGSFETIPLIPGHDVGAGGGAGGSDGGAKGGPASDAATSQAPSAGGAAESDGGGGNSGGGNGGGGNAGSGTPKTDGPKGHEINNQEASGVRVDETDYVKSDGQRIFVAHGDVLRVSDLTGKLLDTHLMIGETPRGLHLAAGRLVLVTEARNALRNSSSIGTMAVADASYWRSYYEFSRKLVWQANQYVQVREFAIGADGRLTLARQRTVGGYFREGREVDGMLHLVSQQSLPWSVLGTGLALDLHPAYSGLRSAEAIRRYAAEVAGDNLKFLHRMMFEHDNELTGDHVRTYAAGDCRRFNRITTQVPDELNGEIIAQMLAKWDEKLAWSVGSVVVPTWFVQYPILPEFNHVVQVVSVDLAGGRDDQRAFSFGPHFPSVVYASADTLVTGGAAATWEGFYERLRLLGDSETHGIVRVEPQPLKSSVAQRFDFVVFALAADGAAPAGFGSVPGVPRDQYALDVAGGQLRVVVTETTGTEPNQVSQILNGNQPQPSTKTETALHVVQPAAGEWKATGRLVLPPYAFVRYFDTSAVLASEKQLIAVDLRDAATPKVAGQLELGVSVQYLHTVGRDGRMLAMGGRDVAVTQPDGCPYRGYPTQVRDLVLLEVDASNPAAMRRGVEATIDAKPALMPNGCLTRPSFASDAERVVKSFRYDGATGLITVPLDMSPAPRTDLLHLVPGQGFGYYASTSSPEEWAGAGVGYRYYDDWGDYWQHGYYRPFWSYSGGGRRFLLLDEMLVKVNGYFDEGFHLGLGARLPAVKHAAALVVTYEAQDPSFGVWRPAGEAQLDRAWTSRIVSQ